MSFNVENNLTNKLKNLLEHNQFENVTSLLKNVDSKIGLEESSWDIVTVISAYLTNQNKCNQELFDCCKSILMHIANECNPSETILELLEQAECLEDDVKFCTILEPLSVCFDKLSKKTKAIEWITSSIQSYIQDLPIPDNEKPIILKKYTFNETCTSTHRLAEVYTNILNFLDPFVESVSLLKSNNDEKETLTLRNYFLSLLISLMGQPLCYIDEHLLKSLPYGQALSDRIILKISLLIGDFYKFLKVVCDRNKNSNNKQHLKSFEKSECNLEQRLYESENIISNLAYSNFYFYLIDTPLFWDMIPQVYSHNYIFYSNLYHVSHFLQQQEYICIHKGFILMKKIMDKVLKSSINLKMIEQKIYIEIFDNLVKIMIFCDDQDERKTAIHIFQEYIQIFDMQAKYRIILYLYRTLQHSSLLSFITNTVKSLIIECLATNPPCLYFLQNNLKTLMKEICKLPNGSNSDLVEISDEVITTLNLLRFLLIRDKINITGIWDSIDSLENHYLKPLRDGIDISKAHWKIKVKDLENQQNMNKSSSITELNLDDNISLFIGGEKLPIMPISEKIKISHQAINGLEVMESILIRVNECMANNPFKQSPEDLISR